AVCLAIGYGIGTLVGRWVHWLLDRESRLPGPVTRRRSWIVLGVGWLIGVLLGAVLWVGWQNEQRNFMGMATIDWFDVVPMVLVSAVAGAALVVTGRVIAKGVGAISRFTHRSVPTVLAGPAAVLLTVVVSVVLGGMAFRALTALAYSHHGSVNESTHE